MADKPVLTEEQKSDRLLEIAPDARLMNCAGCRALIAAFRNPHEAAKVVSEDLGIQKIKGRVKGRPYCAECFGKL